MVISQEMPPGWYPDPVTAIDFSKHFQEIGDKKWKY
jgi:hypothetical protein